MNTNGHSRLPQLLAEYEAELLTAWVQEQQGSLRDRGKLKEREVARAHEETDGCSLVG